MTPRRELVGKCGGEYARAGPPPPPPRGGGAHMEMRGARGRGRRAPRHYTAPPAALNSQLPLALLADHCSRYSHCAPHWPLHVYSTVFTARSSATTRRRLSCGRDEQLRRTGGGGPAPTPLLITAAPTNESPRPTPGPAPCTAQPRPLSGMQTRLLAGGDHHTVTAAATVAPEAATAATTATTGRPPTKLTRQRLAPHFTAP
ncbi:hypothetical protein E2C01_045588 [Portunus trituberculatus]|uniref:Uncharacterized protein n=1 Tax=Portunus trituberculatus TaxID=210409 RepID=A0A5B7G1L3_PORTR|nr:hypothetical protein [Portunus trituberculatus]